MILVEVVGIGKLPTTNSFNTNNMKEPYNGLCSAHFGNGLAIWRTNTKVTIAHIGVDRFITYYKPEIPITDSEKDYIDYLSKNDDREISYTQDTKVFTHRPNTQ